MTQRTLPETTSRSAAKDKRKRASRSGRKRRLLMENLEGRRLLAAGTGTGTSAGTTVDASLFAAQDPRNVGTVTAFQFIENEAAGARGANDNEVTAEVLPLGTLASQEDTIDVIGTMGLTLNSQNQILTDLDYYAVDLRAGDILDIALTGAAGNISVLYGEGTRFPGRFWWGTDINTAVADPLTGEALYAKGSPLQTFGSAVGAQVIPETGDTTSLWLRHSRTTITRWASACTVPSWSKHRSERSKSSISTLTVGSIRRAELAARRFHLGW